MNNIKCDINYTKRKNDKLFHSLKSVDILDMEHVQNYIPIYDRFFNLTSTNYENLNLEHTWHIAEIKTKDKHVENIFNGVLKKQGEENKTRTDNVFCKIVPLVDPYKYMIGKLFDKEDIFKIPTVTDNEYSNEALCDVNNTGYVDGLFVYFSNLLLNNYNFVHGVSYYGSFIGIKRNLRVNIYDDVEYLSTSTFFNEHKNVDFQVDDYSYLLSELMENEDNGKKPPIIIHVDASKNPIESIHCDISNEMFEGIFSEGTNNDVLASDNTITLDDLAVTDLEVVDLVDCVDTMKLDNKSICSSSSCSSRSSHTSNDNDDENDNSDNETNEWSDASSSEESSDSDDSDEVINAYIPKFPVEIIFMEKMDYTLDSIMMDEEGLSDDEWMSILMQVIMTLLVYQNIFSFTHNDLHTNNIMFSNTNKAFLFYKYRGKYYKVPTFGRIAKIIDFGRSIYKYNGLLICSDSFKQGNDAATQYNIEPYFNSAKPRLEPNMSFDLCRLACSIYDEVIDDPEDFGDSAIAKLINEWCKDDNGRNILYKKNGDERYPSFKLYKMIARIVHRHTPENQLERPEFSQYCVDKDTISSKMMKHLMNIDEYTPLK
jgi:hypothetical protein